MTDKSSTEDAAKPKGERFFTGPLALIFTTIFIDLIGFGIVIPILPLYAQSDLFQASPFWVGQLISIFSWMQFFFTPIVGQLSDRYGRRPILFISLIGSAIGYLVVGAGTTFAVIFLGRMISGVTGGSISADQAYVADVTTKENRAKGMGLFGASFGLGFILGPAIAGVLSKYGIAVPFYFAAALSLANAIAVYFFLPESLKPELRSLHANRKGRIATALETLADPQFRVIAGVYFLLIMAFSIMTTAYVLFTAHIFGYDAEHNGYLFAFVGVISVVIQGFLFGFAAKKFGESRLAAAGCVVLAASLFATPFVSTEHGALAGLLAVSAFMAIGNSLATPSLTSLASKTAEAHEQGRAMGVMQSGASLARAIGPTLCGVLLNNSVNSIDHSTIVRTYWTAGGIMVVAFLAALFFLKNVRAAEGAL
jgi:DHA1 family tetracycline resistance protein-like MFS transporter